MTNIIDKLQRSYLMRERQDDPDVWITIDATWLVFGLEVDDLGVFYKERDDLLIVALTMAFLDKEGTPDGV